MQSTTLKETKEKAIELSVLLSQLPQTKLEYVNGYIQGILDSQPEPDQKQPA